MDNNFDVDLELKKLEKLFSGKQQLSTIDLALIYNFCDKYIYNKIGSNVLDIYDKSNSPAEDITRFLIIILYGNPKIFNFINQYGLTEILGQTLYNVGSKEILYISDTVINNSNKRPQQMSTSTDDKQVKRIFESLEKNYHLYKQLYKDKIWIINSTASDGELIGQAKIYISPYQFFHLMGFDYRNILNPNGKDKDGTSHELYAREFATIFDDPQKAYRLIQEFGKSRDDQYRLIEALLECESKRFSTLLKEGKLRNTINIDKIEMKCFAFERMGAIQTASGMIFFDKQKAITLGHGDKLGHINSDIILLNDFIRKYQIEKLFGLDFVISPYDKIKGTQKSEQQSIFISSEPGGGLNSGVLNQQKASISSSVVGYREEDFDYVISELGSGSGKTIPEPIAFTQFPEEDRKRVAQTLIEEIPELDKTNLEEIINNNDNHKQR